LEGADVAGTSVDDVIITNIYGNRNNSDDPQYHRSMDYLHLRHHSQ